MASLREYFADDAKHNMTTHAEWELRSTAGAVLATITARLHWDFDANALYVSFFIPAVDDVGRAEDVLLSEVDKVLALRDSVRVQSGFSNHMHDSAELMFTGQVYLYSEQPVHPDDQQRLSEKYRKVGYHLSFRSRDYLDHRMRAERPKAFISHDSRDKATIAAPLALHLSQRMIPVWYDEYSLKVGDSLRESIERGLKECQRCVLILTPNFLKNGGWSKREYDSIFTRELVERQNLILPVWHEVTVKDVFNYSPALADRFALAWSDGVERVASGLHAAIVRD